MSSRRSAPPRRWTICWSRPADLDLQAAHSCLEERNPSAARLLAAEIFGVIQHICTHPKEGSIASDLLPRGRYQHWICGHHRLIYRIEDDRIWLLRIWDARRDPAQLKAK